MKKNAILFNLLGILFCCGAMQLSASDRCYAPCSSCCEWSFCDGKIILGGDWLFWKVQEDNLSVGSLLTSDVSTPDTTASYKTLNPSFQYDNGFRVNLGYELPCDCWDINVAYSYMPTSARTSTVTIPNVTTTTISPFPLQLPVACFLPNETTETSVSLASKWSANINCVDVDLARTVTFGECLKIRPHVGFRALWIEQKLLINHTFVENVDTVPTTSINTAVMKEHFTGYGVEGGLWGSWELGWGLSIIGHAGGSILYSKFDTHQRFVTTTTPAIAISSSTTTIHDTLHSGTPTADYFVGLQYADCFCDMLFSLVVGWEQHVVFDLNRIALSRGNLVTQGLTLGCQIGF